MEKRILDCKIFNNYMDNEYKIITKHKIFGESKMCSVISGLIEDNDRVGVVVHEKDLFCYKNDSQHKFIEENNMVFMSDGLMEIFIYI